MLDMRSSFVGLALNKVSGEWDVPLLARIGPRGR